MKKELKQYEFLAQVEDNEEGYFIVDYADGRRCALLAFKELNMPTKERVRKGKV